MVLKDEVGTALLAVGRSLGFSAVIAAFACSGKRCNLGTLECANLRLYNYNAMIRAMLVACLLASVWPASRSIAKDVGVPRLPGDSCQTQPLEKWTDQEKWVWGEVCAGRIVNLADEFGGAENVADASNWPEKRILTPAFLETILLHEPFRSALTRNGIHIIGARFTEPLDLSKASLAHELRLVRSSVEKGFDLSNLRSKSWISMDGSKLAGVLNMDGLKVDDTVFMRNGEFADVVLINAKIDGYLDMDDSKITGRLDMDGLKLGGILLMNRGEFAEVVLRGAQVGYQLSMIGSKFSSKLDMDSLKAGSHLFMNDGEFDEVVLVSAQFGGNIEMDGSKFTGKLNMDSLKAGGYLAMRNAEFDKPVEFIFGEVGSVLDLSGSKLSTVDLTGTVIRRELRLGSGTSPLRWPSESRPRLTLRNTVVGAIQDLEDSWPANLRLVLVGFSYERLGGFGPRAVEHQIGSRETDWYVKWLARDEIYSPQPYEQLATVLRKMGHAGKADDILFNGRLRALRETEMPLSQKLWQYSMWLFIGFGYRIYYALVWVAVFVFIGAWVIRQSVEGKKAGFRYGFAYSFDNLLPIIKLREAHYEVDFAGGFRWERYFFYFHQIMGYVLASFLVAGLAGLTK